MLNIHKILGRSNNLFYEDIVGLESKIQNFISNSSFLIVGAAGSIGKEVTKQVFMRGPKKLDAVDINENELADLTRQLRSSFDNNSTSYRSLVIDMGSKIFSNFINQQEKYDYVINLAALKHVRSEKDPFTLMRLIEVNIINSIKLFRLTSPARKYFCVSTDKAANPVNFMGLSKRIMESYLANEQNNLTYSSARFANVAFSNGSILQSFKRRIELRQPIACPSDIERFFVTPEESGQLCLLSIIFGGRGEIFFPKETDAFKLVKISKILENYLESIKLKPHYCKSEAEAINFFKNNDKEQSYWPCFLSSTSTSGEKPFEEFYSEQEDPQFDRFKSIGVLDAIQNKEIDIDFDAFHARYNEIIKLDKFDDSRVKELLYKRNLDFNHAYAEATLDDKM